MHSAFDVGLLRANITGRSLNDAISLTNFSVNAPGIAAAPAVTIRDVRCVLGIFFHNQCLYFLRKVRFLETRFVPALHSERVVLLHLLHRIFQTLPMATDGLIAAHTSSRLLTSG